MDYEELGSRGKITSDGEITRNCLCGGRCYVFYDESERYHVECEHCGEIAKFKANSTDKAIKKWNNKEKTFDGMIKDKEYTNASSKALDVKPYTEKDTCICCGKYIPEGRQVCQECEERNYNGREPWNK